VPYDGSREHSGTCSDRMPYCGTWGLRQDSPMRVENDVFGRWLQRSLHKEFDGIAAEPLPAEWLRLIEGVAHGPRGS
jgi:hypothetical protein